MELQSYNYEYILKKQHWNQVISNKLYSCVNNITLGNKYFIKLWPVGQSDKDIESPYYSLYKMEGGLAFSYFLSNLQEFALRLKTGLSKKDIPLELLSFYYPIDEGKETRLIKQITLEGRDIK